MVQKENDNTEIKKKNTQTRTHLQTLQLQMPRHLGHTQSFKIYTASIFSPYLNWKQNYKNTVRIE